MGHGIVQVVLDTPLDSCFDYLWPAALQAECGAPQPGQVVQVEFGRREIAGLIISSSTHSSYALEKLKPVLAVRAQVPPLGPQWLDMCRFAAAYYQRPLGEVALPALPKNLRAGKALALDKALKKLAKPQANDASPHGAPALNAEQAEASQAILAAQGFAPFLLYGVTGSGKTEVYLQTAAALLARQPEAQVLILVPEINLTPQFEANIRARFPGLALATLHSELAEGERLRNWLAAHLGQARILLGTRMSLLASLPQLALIIIDEEHDPSYKQQEGLRYSARDLAVWRARQLQIPVVLGSATPSLESWQHAQNGRYRLLRLRQRASHAARLPQVGVIDLSRDRAQEGFSGALIAAIRRRLERGEQSLLFLNRRGYAPVLCCEACGWISGCLRCTAHMVLHKPEHRLRCHHCSLELAIPRHCPTCGNIDLQALGRGTQRIEEVLQRIFPEARVLRIDADSTRRKGSAQAAFASVHSGEVDILVGTQMVAKGHDFKRLSLVGILNPDTALFSHDYRASERLFAQLMQVAGRAGRADLGEGSVSEVLLQSRYPQHPLYSALMAHDYEKFAAQLLEERAQACMPPYSYQALLRAEARELQSALDFLQQARSLLPAPGVEILDPIPMTVTRVAHVERAQMLLEAQRRSDLQAFLTPWMTALRGLKSRVKWGLEVDPMDV
ncbi:primosomal protein N' [Massilia sp. W12]|uniref:primosomal protein N' n=1 Tax=Massilia sp. W12 TaxID=3126507 RepID=UPI0030D62391